MALEVRQAAAVSFKNLVKYHWAAREGDGLGAAPPFALPDPEKEQIKAHITDLMLSAPPRVRAQLSEALSIISGHDFPARWQALLPQLIERLGSEDLQLVNGVLSTADSIYQRYRQASEAEGRGGGGSRWGRARTHTRTYPSSSRPARLTRHRGQYMTEQLSTELEYSQQLVRPLLACLQRLTRRVGELGPSGDPAALCVALSDAQLAASVFYSLNSPGLTGARAGGAGGAARACRGGWWWGAAERGATGRGALAPRADAFEETLDAWMAEFHTLLGVSIPALAETDPEKESVVDGVKAAVRLLLRGGVRRHSGHRAHHLHAPAPPPCSPRPCARRQVCEALILFMERNEEEFAKFLQTFAQVRGWLGCKGDQRTPHTTEACVL